ncbi:MAG: hypothetical protein HY703_03305 [Gemmatimonadetes bacterium]|nr:hypothetical protein [Gemmatimonadota bacterium]
MPAVPHSLRVPEELDKEINRELKRRGEREWSSGVLSLVEEAVRMSRAPGIVFVEGRGGRRAAVAFSGLEVWEIVATWKEAGENWGVLRESYAELFEAQLRAALNFYRLYPGGIDDRLELEAYWTPDRVAEEFPFTRPAGSATERG